MTTVKFQCEDPYEAEKLASLMSVQKDQKAYVDGIAAVVGKEIVIKLKDKSSHAVLLKDKENVDKLNSFIVDVIHGKLSVRYSESSGSITEITFD